MNHIISPLRYFLSFLPFICFSLSTGAASPARPLATVGWRDVDISQAKEWFENETFLVAYFVKLSANKGLYAHFVVKFVLDTPSSTRHLVMALQRLLATTLTI